MFRLLTPVALLSVAVAQNLGASFSNTVDGYIEAPYSAQVVPQSGITVEAWITYDDTTLPTGWRFPTILRQGISSGGSEDYFLRVEAGNTGATTLRWRVKTQSGGTLSVDAPFVSGQLLAWTHVAGTYDGATLAIYLDGVLVNSVAGNGSPIRDVGTEVLRIGKGSDVATPIEVWNGEIDEVRLWPFARTAAEILQTRDFALVGVPGLVSTWNLDGHTLDTSGGQHATATGAVTLGPNTLNLTTLPLPSASTVGVGTAGCGPFEMSFGSLPQAGNLAFGPVCTGAPANAVTFLAVAFQTLATPLSVAGIDFWLDSSALLVLAGTDAFGVSRYPAPLPAWLPAGQMLAFQYGFVDPCGSQMVTASNALVTLTQ